MKRWSAAAAAAAVMFDASHEMLVLTSSPLSAAPSLAATWTLFTFDINRIIFRFHRPAAEESTMLNEPESRCSSRSLFCNMVERAQCSSGHTAGRKSGAKSPWVELQLLVLLLPLCSLCL